MVDTPWDEPSETSPEFAAYLSGQLLQYDPWTRIRGQAQSKHITRAIAAYHVDAPDILLRMLDINPQTRITMEGLKTHPWCMTCVHATSFLPKTHVQPKSTEPRTNGRCSHAGYAIHRYDGSCGPYFHNVRFASLYRCVSFSCSSLILLTIVGLNE